MHTEEHGATPYIVLGNAATLSKTLLENEKCACS